MKKLVLVLFAGITFATAHAQGPFQFGVKGGLNVSNVTVSNGFNGYSYSSLANFNGGVFFKIPFLAPGLSLQPEVVYSGQGFKGNDGSGSGGEFSEHINYLNIPVLAKYTWPGGFFLETGPQLSLKLNAKEKENGVSTDVSSAYNGADFSWVVGVGFKIPQSPVGFDFRYNTGILNIANDSYYGNGYGQYAVRNEVFQIDLNVVLWKSSGSEERPNQSYRRYH
jgi:hypothetical protein